MPNPANSATLWSDVVQSPLEDNPLPFSIVARNKKRPRLNNSPETNQPNPAITSNKLESSKLPTKIVGAKKNDNNKLSADKKLIKKSVFAMSNIKKCSRSNVIDYLSEVGIQVISCYPVQKRSLAPSGTLPRNEDEDSTMFRVCINASDTSKIQDPDNLPENVIIREWRPNKQGGGVGIFLREGINYSVLDEVTLSNCVVDYLGIEIKLNNAIIYLYAFYRPPDSDIDLLIQVLNLIFVKLKSKSNTYLVGDFNINLLKPFLNHSVASFPDFLASFNFYPLISKPTRVSQSSSSLIDNIFTNNLSVHSSGILLHDFSDHFPIFTTSSSFEMYYTTTPPKVSRNLSYRSLEQINFCLSNQDWSSVTTLTDINECCTNFYFLFFRILDAVSPQLPSNQLVSKVPFHNVQQCSSMNFTKSQSEWVLRSAFKYGSDEEVIEQK
ncbi:hypothetical protein HELRODRAFT_184519, partial [Helobdella robusta]|uniref:Endonuclease/exonuclease/phosphatase domain-containing protein n=1 Tax=Helobdella robusta TaxID=6412 RepID=T1FLD8_HELRO